MHLRQVHWSFNRATRESAAGYVLNVAAEG